MVFAGLQLRRSLLNPLFQQLIRVTDRLFCPSLRRCIAKNENNTMHAPGGVANRGRAVGDGALTAISCDERRMVGKFLDCTGLQHFGHGHDRWHARVLVDDTKHLVNGSAPRLRQRPASESLRHRIHARDMPRKISSQHPVAYGMQCGGKTFLAFGQRTPVCYRLMQLAPNQHIDCCQQCNQRQRDQHAGKQHGLLCL
jgi:hypothetical protein